MRGRMVVVVRGERGAARRERGIGEPDCGAVTRLKGRAYQKEV